MTYTYSTLTENELTSLYLYGTTTPPAEYEDRLRPSTSPQIDLSIDAVSYMADGSGRYATGDRFAAIQAFFQDTTLTANTYSATSLKASLGLTDAAFQTVVRQSQEDPSSADYGKRTYIYNSTSFVIEESAVAFHVEADGTHWISGLTILPYEDNFDFSSEHLLAILGNAVLKEKIDPYDIGRRVELSFINKSSIPAITYNSTDFQSDNAHSLSIHHDIADSLFAANAAMQSLMDVMELQKIFEYELDDGTSIAYGTSHDDAVTWSSTNKLIYVAGDGADTIMGGVADDKLYGGNGDDTMLYGAGHDNLDGGADRDMADFSSAASAQKFVFSVDSNDSDFIASYDSNLQNYGASGVGKLIAIENVVGSDHNDIFEIVQVGSALESLNGGAGRDQLDFRDVTNGITIAATPNSGSSTVVIGNDHFQVSNFEKVFGSTHNDTIDFSTSDDDMIIVGGVGADVIRGGSGDDILVDEASFYGRDESISLPYGSPTGPDYLYGGGGSDAYGVTAKASFESALNFDYSGNVILAEEAAFDLSSTFWSKATIIEDVDGVNTLFSSAFMDISPWGASESVFVSFDYDLDDLTFTHQDGQSTINSSVALSFDNIVDYYATGFMVSNSGTVDDQPVDVYTSYAASLVGADLYLWASAYLDGAYGDTSLVNTPIAVLKNFDSSNYSFHLA
jgi:Ca2+-binding RTX toxin-like protein